jgi:predicted dehydrogenase
VDAVVIATPDHWHEDGDGRHGQGKDVYLEKPMVHTNEEARQLVATVKETGVSCRWAREPSADIWWKAKKAIADGRSAR